MTTPFWKTQALGNDFVLVHEDAVCSTKLADLATRVCKRHTGVGSDGLLVIGPSLVLRMFNPDGTEDFCGNGLRCGAWHARNQAWASDSMVLTHLGVRVPATVEGPVVSVELGTPTFDPRFVPLDVRRHPAEMWMEPFHGLRASAVSTGTTHLVALVDELPDDDTFTRVSSQIETDPLFPERTSVLWTRRGPGREAKLRIWERGVGETLACGTGNVAVAAVLTRLDGRGGVFEIGNPGGTSHVTIRDDLSHPVITSEVCETFTGTLCIA